MNDKALDAIAAYLAKRYEPPEPINGWFTNEVSLQKAIQRKWKKCLEKVIETHEQTIAYQDCADALLKMWVDKVLTDAEYNMIMDKLNASNH